MPAPVRPWPDPGVWTFERGIQAAALRLWAGFRCNFFERKDLGQCAWVRKFKVTNAGGQLGDRTLVRLRVRTNSGVKVPVGQSTGCP